MRTLGMTARDQAGVLRRAGLGFHPAFLAVLQAEPDLFRRASLARQLLCQGLSRRRLLQSLAEAAVPLPNLLWAEDKGWDERRAIRWARALGFPHENWCLGVQLRVGGWWSPKYPRKAVPLDWKLPEGLSLPIGMEVNAIRGPFLPRNLSIRGTLTLQACPGDNLLPEGLCVSGLRISSCEDLTTLPQDLLIRRSLILSNCPNLRSLPALLPPLVRIEGCPHIAIKPEDRPKKSLKEYIEAFVQAVRSANGNG